MLKDYFLGEKTFKDCFSIIGDMKKSALVAFFFDIAGKFGIWADGGYLQL